MSPLLGERISSNKPFHPVHDVSLLTSELGIFEQGKENSARILVWETPQPNYGPVHVLVLDWTPHGQG
jgi:hypothetical protein